MADLIELRNAHHDLLRKRRNDLEKDSAFRALLSACCMSPLPGSTSPFHVPITSLSVVICLPLVLSSTPSHSQTIISVLFSCLISLHVLLFEDHLRVSGHIFLCFLMAPFLCLSMPVLNLLWRSFVPMRFFVGCTCLCPRQYAKRKQHLCVGRHRLIGTSRQCPHTEMTLNPIGM